MHGISRFKQTVAEVKYNVTTDFPHLGLHAAAVTGDLGLVNYALSHGQPINSVLHGVLPLHAACSGGDELVVNLLIENGADVNAPRLPLRYTNDKNRDASAPIVGTSGSTPLHFACANGHTNVVLILLQHGAHPDRADKHGITPEVLARETGHDACADMIRRWIDIKDQDLKNRAEYTRNSPIDDRSSFRERRRSFNENKEATRRHLVMKRSIDHALNLFKMPSTSALAPLPTTYVSPSRPSSPSPTSYLDDGGHLTRSMSEFEEDFPPRRPSLPHIFNNVCHTPPKQDPSSRRPSSAGADAEALRGLGAGRSASKYSLRNIFRKHGGEGAPTESPPQLQHSVSSSPPGDRRLPIQSQGSSSTGFFPQKFRSRLMSDGDLDPRPHMLSAMELHHKFSAGHMTLSPEVDVNELVLDPPPSTRNSAMRQGILRGHNRSSSSGQHPSSASRALSPRRIERLFGLKVSNSANSLRSDALGAMPSTVASTPERDAPDSAPPTITTFLDVDDVEECDGLENNSRHYSRMSRLDELKLEHKELEEGFAASSSSFPDEGRINPATKDFPFSISKPPLTDSEPKSGSHEMESAETRLRGNSISSIFTNASVDNPQLSSSGTTSGSASVSVITPAMHSLPLPAPRMPMLSPVYQDVSYEAVETFGDGKSKQDSSFSTVDSGDLSSISIGRYDGALDIDINSISSHAQAEALVLRAQKSILDMEGDFTPTSDIGSGRSPLSAKLAAYGESLALERRLKREEEERGARRPNATVNSGSNSTFSLSAPPRGPYHARKEDKDPKSLDRKFSLEEKGADGKRNSRKVRRPHTAGSTGFETTDGRLPRLGVGRHSPESPLRVHIVLDSPNRKRELTVATESVEIVEISPTPIHCPEESPSGPGDPQSPLYSGSTAESPSRSHTPDAPSEMFDSFQTVQGMSLSRVSSVPLQSTINNLLPKKNQREHARQVSRTNKLVKMGFSASEATQNVLASSARHTSSVPRFSGFRSLVHSLKGKGSH